MSILSSAQKQGRKNTVLQETENTIAAPVVLGERSLIAFAVVRVFFGYLWFQQLFWKLPPNFVGLHSYVVNEGKYTFIPGYSFIIQHVFLPNFILLGAGTWIAELIVALCLLFGIFSRFGGLLATILALQLYVGLAVAPGEWYWTYGMIVLLGAIFTIIPAGRRWGVDQLLAPRLQARSNNNRFSRFLSWFV